MRNDRLGNITTQANALYNANHAATFNAISIKKTNMLGANNFMSIVIHFKNI